MFSIMVVLIHISTNSIGGFLSLHVFSDIYYLQTFWWWPSWLVWGSFDLHFSNNQWGLASLHMSFCHLYVFFKKCLFRSSAHVLIGLFVLFFNWAVWAILEINPLSVTSFATHSVGCLFILFMVSFAMQKLLSLIRSHLFIFVFISITLGDRSKMILLQFMLNFTFESIDWVKQIPPSLWMGLIQSVAGLNRTKGWPSPE